MALIEIHLRDGWEDDHVRIAVDGVNCLDQQSVTTDYALGLAWIESLTVEPGRHTLEVEVLSKNSNHSAAVFVGEELYIGLDLGEDRLLFHEQVEQFRYF